MNIILTGATGFLGSTIARRLANNDHDLYALIRENSSIRRIEDLLKKNNFHVLRPSKIEPIFKTVNVDAVVHTATVYGRQGESPKDMEEANINLPIRLLEYGIQNGLKCFINSDTFLLPENTVDRNKRYVLTKKSFLEKARKILPPGIVFANMKIEQMYGPDDNPTKFIPSLIGKLLLSNVSRVPLNPGDQARDYVYVDDVVEAYLAVLNSLDKLNGYKEFDIGTGETHTLKDLVKEICALSEKTSEPGFGDLSYGLGEVMLSRADISNNVLIGWKAQTSFSEGIVRTVAFYTKK
jgi:nucleoside-diphosphate-sugar epimerase